MPTECVNRSVVDDSRVVFAFGMYPGTQLQKGSEADHSICLHLNGNWADFTGINTGNLAELRHLEKVWIWALILEGYW